MSYILGIDTGGTYTDAVMVDRQTKEVRCKAKAFTTKADLSRGIDNCLKKLRDADFGDIDFVALSTTLATNALVEGKGCKVGLIVSGEEVSDSVAADEIIYVGGKMNIIGREIEPLHEDEVSRALDNMEEDVCGIAVSGYASVRNPKHEKRIAEIAKSRTDLPIVCAHQLTSVLGFNERTVTAVLNARLIPIIEEFITSVHSVLDKRNIDAPVMIVKGDGALMQEEMACQRPIETILSGPAASVIGAAFLGDTDTGLVADMGGTTLDLAYLDKGQVKIDKRGACVGGWNTSVKAAKISTYGVGGDSYIYLDARNAVHVGPEKVKPLCVAACEYPNILKELKKFEDRWQYPLVSGQEIDCFEFIKMEPQIEYTEEELKVLDAVCDQPHSAFQIAEMTGMEVENLPLKNLVRNAAIRRISLSPTCILHYTGEFRQWDVQAVKMAIKALAFRKRIGEDELVGEVKQAIIRAISLHCIDGVSRFDENASKGLKNNKCYMTDCFLRQGENMLLKTRFQLQIPVIGIGAPAGMWMREAAQRIETTFVLPEHYEVANAVGAAVANIMESVTVLIRPDSTRELFHVYAPDEKRQYQTLDEAKSAAEELCRAAVEKACAFAGGSDCEIVIRSQDVINDIFTENRTEYVETKVTGTAIGKPGCIDEK